MPSEIVVVEPREQALQQSSPIFGATPEAMVAQASHVATVLRDVIDKQRLYSDIQGKKYVTVGGWQALGSMLGFLPEEVPGSVKEVSPGVWEATVEVRSVRSGMVAGRGSAICSHKERRWASADDYARRSMAVTRATGKAFRTGLGWIMSLAGYEATPAEEMPHEERKVSEPLPRQADPAQAGRATPEVFNKDDGAHLGRLESLLEKHFPSLSKEAYLKVAAEMHGEPMTKTNVENAVNRADITTIVEGVFA